MAGSDSSGGAGIQADLKTFSALGVYGASVITAITAQNTFGVQAAAAVDAELVAQQIASVLSDLQVGAIKTGMLHNEKIIACVCQALQHNKIPLVIDPVMVATSGDRLLSESAISTLAETLLPMATLITPNLEEAAVLLNCAPAKNINEIEQQARQLLTRGCQAVLLKGGHLAEKKSADIFVSQNSYQRFDYEKIPTHNTHGTGCTLSAAVAAYLAQGLDLLDAVSLAREYLYEAILHADDLRISKSQGGNRVNQQRHGPVHHFYRNW
jgi:hydroxymethylpyrimidine/phosphomethylpyrimidine kinase